MDDTNRRDERLSGGRQASEAQDSDERDERSSPREREETRRHLTRREQEERWPIG